MIPTRLTAASPCLPSPWRESPSRRSLSRPSALLLLIGFVWALLIASPATANPIGDAQKQANEFFKNRTWTAKLPFETSGRYFMDPSGQPLGEKKQGRRRGLGIGQRDVAFPVGFEGRGTYIRVDGSDREVVVTLQKKRGPTMHSARMYIQYGRDISADDLAPEAIARALSPYVAFEGINPDREFADAVEALEAASDTASTRTAPTASSTDVPAAVSALQVTVLPERVVGGGEAVLELTFDVGGTPGTTTDVFESRTLSFDGSRLPSFPVERNQSREPGRHTSRYRQVIPAGASPGVYTLKGEVCAATDCVSRLVTFEVVPD